MTPSMARHDCDHLDKALAKSWAASCGGHRGRSAALLIKTLTLPASRAPSTKPAARRRISQMPHAGARQTGRLAWFLVGATHHGSSSSLQDKLINQRCRDQRAPSRKVLAAKSTHARRTAARSQHQQRSHSGAATRQRLERDEVRTSRRLGRRPLASRPACGPSQGALDSHRRSAWASYESTSEMKSFASLVAKFEMSLGGACPSGVDRLPCSRSMSSK
jgi:hypothetical protein